MICDWLLVVVGSGFKVVMVISYLFIIFYLVVERVRERELQNFPIQKIYIFTISDTNALSFIAFTYFQLIFFGLLLI